MLIMSTDPDQRRKRFRDESLAAWRSLVEDLAQGRLAVSWSSLPDIIHVLAEVARRAPYNHLFFPDGGGLDLTRATVSHESECLELGFGDSSPHIVRPATLQLVVPERDPRREWAYLRLETAPLAPSGVNAKLTGPSEEVVELSPGKYVDSSGWDENILGYDRDGAEIPMPRGARRVVRGLGGALLLMSKSSPYYANSASYQGTHDTLSAEEFRAVIDEHLGKLHRSGRYDEHS